MLRIRLKKLNVKKYLDVANFFSSGKIFKSYEG